MGHFCLYYSTFNYSTWQVLRNNWFYQSSLPEIKESWWQTLMCLEAFRSVVHLTVGYQVDTYPIFRIWSTLFSRKEHIRDIMIQHLISRRIHDFLFNKLGQFYKKFLERTWANLSCHPQAVEQFIKVR